ncbi:phosphotransferase [Jannaschia rubra]
MPRIATDGRSVVVKHELRPDASEGFAAQYHMLRTVRAACRWDDRLNVPRPIHLDVERRACLLEYASGEIMSNLMRASRDDPAAQAALLRRAGTWLDRFHGDQLDARRPFRPKFTLRWFRRLRDEIERGDRSVPHSDVFLRGVRMLEAIAPRFDGGQTASCAKHGDLHMRNLIPSDRTVWGLEVSKADPAPVVHDIAKLLFDHVSLFVAPSEIPAGGGDPSLGIGSVLRWLWRGRRGRPERGLPCLRQDPVRLAARPGRSGSAHRSQAADIGPSAPDRRTRVRPRVTFVLCG